MYALLNERQAEVLNYILIQRVVSFSELRDSFFASVSRQAAMKSIKGISEKLPSLIDIKSRGVGAKKFVVAKPVAGLSSTYTDHDIIVSEIRELFLSNYKDAKWISEFEMRLGILRSNISSDLFKFSYQPDGAVIFSPNAGEKRVVVGIEVEKSLKTKRRIRERLLGIEDALLTQCDYFLVFAYAKSIFTLYQEALSQIAQNQRRNLTQLRTRIILLDSKSLEKETFLKTIEEKLK